jgi:hypothetical protein
MDNRNTYRGEGLIVDLLIHNLCTEWRLVIRFISRPLCPRGKSLLYPLQGSMVPKAGLIMFEVEINILLLSKHGPSVVKPVA